MKKFAFTLSEVLITLSIVGVVSVLVLPNLMGDAFKKANVAKVQATLVAVNDALKNAMIEERVRDVYDSTFITDPEEFLNTYLKPVKVCDGDDVASCGFGGAYGSIDGSRKLGGAPVDGEPVAAAILPSGVSIMIGDSPIGGSNGLIGIYIDVNGSDKPNIIGRDFFAADIMSDFTSGVGSGFVTISEGTSSDILTNCKKGSASSSGLACLYLLQTNDWKMEY